MRLPIRQKLASAFLLMAVLMAAAGAYSVSSFSRLHADTEEILHRQQPIMINISDIESNILSHSLKVDQYITTGNTTHLKDVNEFRNRVGALLVDLDQRTQSSTDKVFVQEIKEAYQTYLNLSDELRTSYENNPNDTALITGRKLRIAALLENALLLPTRTQFDIKQRLSAQLITKYHQLYRSQVVIVIGLSIILTLLAFGGGLLISRSITIPIGRLIDTSRQVSGGDLTARTTVQTGDEIETLACAFNAMTTQLQNMVTTLEQRIAERTAALAGALQVQQAQAEELQTSLATQQQLYQTIADLSIPIIPLRKDVLVVPLIGTITEDRANLLTQSILQNVETHRARIVFLDVTGVALIDTAVATALIRTTDAVQLLGALPVLVGIRPEVAQTLVSLDVDLSTLRTEANLESGLKRIAIDTAFTCGISTNLTTLSCSHTLSNQ